MKKIVAKGKGFIKKIFISICIVVLLIVTAIYRYNSSDPIEHAVRLIEKDLGYSITCERIYYSKKESACVVVYIHQGVEDKSTVDLKSEKVGYLSVFNEVNSNYNSSNQKEARIKYNALNNAYDVFMAFRATSLENDWKLIYDKENNKK